MKRVIVGLAALLAVGVLTGCSGDDPPAPPSGGESAATLPTEPVVFDEVEVMRALGVEEGEFVHDGYVAEYRWKGPDGTVCFISNIITDEGEASMAPSHSPLNPAGTAGVEFYADTKNLATCTRLLTDALADFPSAAGLPTIAPPSKPGACYALGEGDETVEVPCGKGAQSGG